MGLDNSGLEGKKKHSGGRPTKYRPEYCDQIISYFSVQPQQVVYKKDYYKDGALKSETPVVLPEQFPTFQGFAAKIGVNVDTLAEWRTRHRQFSGAYARARELQEYIWLVNGMSGHYNPQFAQFFGKNCLGYKDRTETELAGSGGGALEIKLGPGVEEIAD